MPGGSRELENRPSSQSPWHRRNEVGSRQSGPDNLRVHGGMTAGRTRSAGRVQPYVNAALIDEFSIALSPLLFGSGIRLFGGVDAGRVALEQVRAEPTQRVTHLTYPVR